MQKALSWLSCPSCRMWRKRGAAAALVTYVLLVLAISDTDLVLAHLRPVPDRWRGKAVLVTGASSGIGEALALALSAEGAYLVLAARDLGKLKAVQQRLASPEQSAIVQLDMGEPESMPSRAREIMAATPAGRLDGFVNNAGISQRESVLTTSYETELRLMTVNHLGPMALTKALLPSLIESGGCILSMNSSARVAACMHTPNPRLGYPLSTGCLPLAPPTLLAQSRARLARRCAAATRRASTRARDSSRVCVPTSRWRTRPSRSPT